MRLLLLLLLTSCTVNVGVWMPDGGVEVIPSTFIGHTDCLLASEVRGANLRVYCVPFDADGGIHFPK